MLFRRALIAFGLLTLAASAHAQVVPQPGPPINIACAYNTTPVTLTDGQAGWIQCDSSGKLSITSTLSGTGANNADNVASVSTGLIGTVAYNYIYDGATWDRWTGAVTSTTQAPVAPATATATTSNLAGCQATSAAINPTTGQQAAVDCDLNNNLLVSSGGAPNLTIAQVSIATSDTLAIAARALRRSVTIQQITGTQNVFCNQTTATAGNGVVLPAVVGASFTFNTTSAIRCIAITGAQTVAIAETY